MSGLSCGIWYLVSWSGIELRPPALGVQSLSHWATREVLRFSWINIPSFAMCCEGNLQRMTHTHIYIYDFIIYIYSYSCSTEKRVCRAPHTTIPQAVHQLITFYCWVGFHCMYGPQFVYSLIHWWTFESSLVWGYYKDALINCVQDFVLTYAFILLSSFSPHFIPPRNGMTGLYRRLMFKILRNY